MKCGSNLTSRARENADNIGSSRGSPGLGERAADERRTDHLIPQTVRLRLERGKRDCFMVILIGNYKDDLVGLKGG